MGSVANPTGISSDGSETFAGASAVSGTRPLLAETGFKIFGLRAVSVKVRTVGGGNLAGAGTVQLYIREGPAVEWSRFSARDGSVTENAGQAQMFSLGLVVGARPGAEIKAVPAAVTYSGGGTAGVVIEYLGDQAQAVLP